MSKDRPATVQQMIGYPPKILRVDGATYKLGFNDQDAKGCLEEIISGKVWDRVYAEAERMKPLTAEKHIARHEKLFAQGYYATGGEGWGNEIHCPEGAILFFLSLLQEHQPETTPEEAARLFNAEPVKCKQAIAGVAPDFFTAIFRQVGRKMGANPDAVEEIITKEVPKLVAAFAEPESETEPMPEPALVT